ncbi:hypothetical protein WJX79_009907 [Trebouxia sp. C0005]
MRRHFAALNAALGQSTSEDLRTLGRKQVADDLQKAVKACIQQEYADSLAPAQAVVAAAWKTLQQDGWDHPAWREAYSFAQLCIAASHISLNDSRPTDPNDTMHMQPLPSSASVSLGLILSSVPQAMPQLDPDRTIARRSAAEMTAAEFKKQYWKTDTPVIISGAMDSWNAMREWPDLQWWNHNHGHRTIPVELGTDSTNSWKETTMLLHTFMTGYMQPSVSRQPGAEVAYIAQHPLFDQLPSLMSDLQQPELMGGEAMQMNAWIGTEGTVTPLHFDSYDNFLAQVAGFKFLRLYSRQQTPLLYVERGQATQSAMNATRAQKNISAVNVEHPDLKKHPGFAQAKHLECVLGPGDMLFIPAKVVSGHCRVESAPSVKL